MAQVKDLGYSVKDVSERLGICTKSMYDWIGKIHHNEPEAKSKDAGEIRRLKADLRLVNEEHDIL